MQGTMKDKLKDILKFIGKAISVLSIAFIAYAIYKLGFDFESITNWPLFLLVAIVSVIIKCITVYITGSAWAGWLCFFSGKAKIDKREAVCVYAKANIGKYLPGNVMHYVERNLFATNLGISQKKLTAGTIIEVLGLVLVAFIMAVTVSARQLLTAFNQIFGSKYPIIIVLAVSVAILCIGLAVFLFRKRIYSIIKEYEAKNFIKTALLAMLQYAIVLAALGVIMLVLYLYMGGTVTFHEGSMIISGYIIAWVLGFVIPGASGGIGVRELVITMLLGPVVGTETVLTLSVIHRLITIVGDFLAYLIMLLIRR